MFSNDRSASPELNPAIQAWKKQLAECMQNVEKSGEFAFAGKSIVTVNPCISVKGISGIGLPLSDRDADAVIATSHQAPFGKGTETRIDTNVRKTWEITADYLDIKNPAWKLQIENLLVLIAAKMGLKGVPITAQLYKLLLYEKGAIFKPHQE
jgi:hypothetical protein